MDKYDSYEDDPDNWAENEVVDVMFNQRVADFRQQIRDMQEALLLLVRDDYAPREYLNRTLDSTFRKLMDSTTDPALAEAIRLEL